ncbi:MAG: YihY/virulence factor BrkB family protein [Hyphomicrobiales bacterium]|nr:YihY/virulence factor BrkB family protein [Hyphomicrobiales bacterium]
MRKAWRVLYDSWLRFSADDGWAIASHIALSGLTSLFPFLIVVGALTGFVGSPSLAARATQLVFETWPPEVAGPIASEVTNVLTRPRTGVAAFGALLGVYFASSGVEAVRVGLNRAYDVRDTRAWWLLRIESIVAVIIGAVALIVFTFFVVLQPLVWEKAEKFVPQLAHLQALVTLVRIPTIAAILLIVMVIAHKYLPAGRRRFLDVLPGVALTGVLWLSFGEGFGLYLARFSQNYITTYAGLASVMVALVFLYTLSAMFIFGGEVNAAIMRATAMRRAAKKGKADAIARAGSGDV